MGLNGNRKDATAVTVKRHKEILESMDPRQAKAEREGVEAVRSHMVLQTDEDITDENGNILWNRSLQNKLMEKGRPDTVNPYLWEMYCDGHTAGVIKLTDGVYAVIGIESSNIGFIRSKNGWIVQDAGGSTQAAQIALDLMEKAVGENVRDNVKALILSHTHVDHLGGAKEIVGGKDIPVIAPGEFEQSLVDDNLYAGIAMSRRLQYQCGLFLQPDEKGRVSIGLSSTLGVRGTYQPIMPNQFIDKDQTIDVDGISLTFMLTPNTETRAHMCTYLDDYKVLYLGDNGVGTLHNTYTMRGAPVRDANYWGKLFYGLCLRFGDQLEAVYQGHGIPHLKDPSKPDSLKEYLLDNAVSYKFTNDQALLLVNKGYNINEVGREFEIPDEIARTWYTRGHYGSYSFNARGTVQKYLGFYDGNPVSLLPLSQQEIAKKLVEYVGSEELILNKAVKDYEEGDYQWVATVTNTLVYLNPQNMDARYLCADALEQLGYQSENALWRNAYLSAAVELRNPDFAKNLHINAMNNDDVIPFVSAELLLDHLGINFDGQKGINIREKFTLAVEDKSKTEYHAIEIYKGTVLHWRLEDCPEKDVATITKDGLYRLAAGKIKHPEELPKELAALCPYVVDTAKYQNFNLVEPNIKAL